MTVIDFRMAWILLVIGVGMLVRYLQTSEIDQISSPTEANKLLVDVEKISTLLSSLDLLIYATTTTHSHTKLLSDRKGSI